MDRPTQDEIVARLRERMATDIFGFETREYLTALDFAHAREFLKPEATAEKWGEVKAPSLDSMREYMKFAWEKANGCRGISANRSIAHYVAWTWIIGDREFSAAIERMFDKEYRWYGKAILRHICEHYEWDWRSLDDGHWRDNEGDDGVSADEALS